jgi:hypothetical protein
MRAPLPLLIAGLVLALVACSPAAEAPVTDDQAPTADSVPAQAPAAAPPSTPDYADEAAREAAAPAAVPVVAVDSQLFPRAQAGCVDEIAMATNTDRTTLTVTDIEQAGSGISVLVHVPGSDGRWFCLANADGTVQGTELRAN